MTTLIEQALAAVEVAEEALAAAEREKFRLHHEVQQLVAAGEPSEPAARELRRQQLQELADRGALSRSVADQARSDLQRAKERRDRAARELDSTERQVGSLRTRATEAERQRARLQAEADAAQRTRDQALLELEGAEAILTTLKPRPAPVAPTPAQDPAHEPAQPSYAPPARTVFDFGNTRHYDSAGREVARDGNPLPS